MDMKTGSGEDVKKAGDILVSMQVSFGPAFAREELTNRAFVEKLRTEGNKHMKGFVGTMMNHFADHIEAAARTGSLSLDDKADTDPNTTYYGQGSCTGCPGDDGSGANCCLCEYNGQHVGCEAC
jgi:hypothetical protein